jgi:hypothetical protein
VPDEDTTGRVRLSTGSIVAPLLTLSLLFIFWRIGQKWLAIPVILAVILYYALVPKLVKSRADRFHREALRLLSFGKPEQIPALARRNLLLQLFGSSGPIDAKLGLAYAQIGDFGRAAPSLENALGSAPDSERPALEAALAKALFVTGDPARAEKVGRDLLRRGTRLPEPIAVVARSRVGLGKIDDTTRSLLDEASSLSPGKDVELMLALTRIEADIATGRRVSDPPSDADSEQRFVRTWIHYVRGLVREHRGNLEGAAESYSRAEREGRDEFCWFAGLAHERLERLARSSSKPANADTALDPALRRKKRKR